MTERPFGTMDPNSQHQIWSRWIFGVEANPQKLPKARVCAENARTYFAKLFRSTVGRVRCDAQGTYYCFVAEMEGPPAHDPAYARSVRRGFRSRFMAQGFGAGARLVRFDVAVLAGDTQDGKPPEQMLVMPPLSSALPTGHT